MNGFTTAAPFPAVSKTGVSNKVYGILGGPESDRALHKKTLDLLGPSLQGKKVLDTGVGRGHLTLKIAGREPLQIFVSDYEFNAAEKVARKIQKSLNELPEKALSASALEASTPNVHYDALDLRSNLPSLERQKFDVIVCVSVLMHIPVAESEQSILKLASHLEPGGKLLIGVLNSTVAKQCFIHAPTVGKDCYYPRLKGLPPESGEDDYPESARCLLEHYPEANHYEQACQKACEEYGCELSKHFAYGGEDCFGGIYTDFVGKPLWDLYVILKT